LLDHGVAGAQATGFAVFLAGYLAVLATPGPNLLAIGGTAALQGRRKAVGLCAGTATGACLLSALLLLGASAGPDAPLWRAAGAVAGAAMMLWVARSIARAPPPPGPGTAPAGRPGGAAFAAGFVTGAANPVTAAFFLSQFVGPLSGGGAALAFVPLLVFLVALAFFLAVAALLSRPVPRAAAAAWHRPIRLAAAGALVFLAARSVVGACAAVGLRPSGPFLAGLAASAALFGASALLLAAPDRARRGPGVPGRAAGPWRRRWSSSPGSRRAARWPDRVGRSPPSSTSADAAVPAARGATRGSEGRTAIHDADAGEEAPGRSVLDGDGRRRLGVLAT
jgi:threonine/homoserine/homoserine lactone efflux protein